MWVLYTSYLHCFGIFANTFYSHHSLIFASKYSHKFANIYSIWCKTNQIFASKRIFSSTSHTGKYSLQNICFEENICIPANICLQIFADKRIFATYWFKLCRQAFPKSWASMNVRFFKNISIILLHTRFLFTYFRFEPNFAEHPCLVVWIGNPHELPRRRVCLPTTLVLPTPPPG